jgi:exopolyphosphatase/guanosine-5'-triphosphate,3'-diphosphate pyrophosphatase
METKLAVIDLGTNTFQLAVAQRGSDRQPTIVLQRSTPSRIGKDGINHGIITEEGIERAISILNDFRLELDELGVENEHISVFGTSAIRNAENRDEVIKRIAEGPGFHVQIIDGDEEAGFIYLGVRQAVDLGSSPQLIMDIGGGSVEFIIANSENIYWKGSFEIGGQRLLEKFVKTDPISGTAIRQINTYLEQHLIPLSNAIHQYAPKTLVGSSGSFETLAEMEYWHTFNSWPPAHQKGFDLSLETFQRSSELILSKNREERLKIAGMKELRVDLIIVAIPLIHYVMRTYSISELKASRNSLKEGVLSTLL